MVQLAITLSIDLSVSIKVIQKPFIPILPAQQIPHRSNLSSRPSTMSSFKSISSLVDYCSKTKKVPLEESSPKQDQGRHTAMQ